MKPKLRAVAYMRKSTRDQQENSIFNQRKAIDSFAERQDISIIKYFTDDGISGLTMEKRNAFKTIWLQQKLMRTSALRWTGKTRRFFEGGRRWQSGSSSKALPFIFPAPYAHVMWLTPLR